ncbi:MAG TPA: hypothetical protein VGE52_19475, partial [Pirellulales bacterium]
AAVAAKGKAACEVIGLATPGDKSDRELLQAALAGWANPAESTSSDTNDKPAASRTTWLVLIGHGTFDGKTARFNLRGPDVSADELKGWLPAAEALGGPLAIVDCTSCSGPFLAALSGPNRVVAVATKSGHEYNFARFGDYFSSALGDPSADLDKDEQTSLLEAFLRANSRVREFYESDHRLATEHALIDDNGDSLGTPGEWFQGLRPTKQAKAGAALDGSLAARLVLAPSDREESWSPERRARRDALEQQLVELRLRKSTLPEAEYLTLLEPVLIELAKLSRDEPQASEAPEKNGTPTSEESSAVDSVPMTKSVESPSAP